MENVNLIVAGICGTIAGVMIFWIILSMTGRQVVKPQTLLDRRASQLATTQQNIGNRIYNALVTAGTSNPASDRICTNQVIDGSFGYTIIFSWHGKSIYNSALRSVLRASSYQWVPFLQININMSRACAIGVSYGPDCGKQHGSSFECGANEWQIKDVIETLSEYVRTYSSVPIKTV